MLNKVAFLTLCFLVVNISTASAQLFQPYRKYAPIRQYQPYAGQAVQQGYPQQQQPNRYQYQQQQQRRYNSGQQTIVRQPTQLTPAQKLEFQRKERARAALARRRQQEIEKQGPSKTLYPRLVGEFEKQQAVLFSICDWQPQHYGILRELVEKTAGHTRLVVLYDDKKQLASALKVLSKSGKPQSHVDFLEHDLDTVWLRDFGPRLAEKENGDAMSIDFYYDGTRPKDDEFPESWAQLTNAEFNHVPWTLQGGNLMSNGKGLSIASTRIFDDNRVQFPASPGRNPIQEQQNFVTRQFKLFCNIKEFVLLQPLENESTKHVDMFSTFLAPDLILMAQVDRRYDPRNAQILDQNARKMSQVKVDGKPMRVERITVPPRNGKYWSPYTNIVLTDRLVLMPTFKSDPPAYVRQAVETYRRLLPNHHVETIDMTSMAKLEGSLHCLSCNVPEFATLPRGLVNFQQALSQYATLVANAPNWVVPDSASKFATSNGASSSSPSVKVSKPVIRDQQLKNQASAISKPQVKARTTQTLPKERSTAINDGGATSSDSQTLEYKRRIAKAREAIKTYRRKFHSASREHNVDAYIVKVGERSVTLMKADSKQELQVRLSYLHANDREWAVKNREQINNNGQRVADFLLNFDQ